MSNRNSSLRILLLWMFPLQLCLLLQTNVPLRMNKASLHPSIPPSHMWQSSSLTRSSTSGVHSSPQTPPLNQYITGPTAPVPHERRVTTEKESVNQKTRFISSNTTSDDFWPDFIDAHSSRWSRRTKGRMLWLHTFTNNIYWTLIWRVGQTQKTRSLTVMHFRSS